MCMNKYLFPLLFVMLFLGTSQASAQRSGSVSVYSREASAIVSKYKTELTQIRQNVAEVTPDSAEKPVSPFLFRLFGPGVYYRSVMEDKLKMDYTLPGTNTSIQSTGLM